ncbi:unnamed protein product [Wuchereria bancrofti]|uniref:Uncharacterized protein n=1 Tax=Wuchereria bancrofti TaxID=6293 RepID=A0A3P7G0K8_WUCBA|nr:unnamed protein product [Wuchereria bancrofti]
MEQQRWAERAIGKEAWERRQQSGEYDSASISSSIANRFRIKKQERDRTNVQLASINDIQLALIFESNLVIASWDIHLNNI